MNTNNKGEASLMVIAAIIIILAAAASAVYFWSNYQAGTKKSESPTPSLSVKPSPTQAPQTGGKVLDLSNQNLTKIPGDVFNQTNLTELNVSGNKIGGAVQSQINQLKNLVVLNLSNNLMTGLPAEIGQLSNLEVLDVSNNQLTGLPYELGNLKKLKIFKLSGNNYSEQDLNLIKSKLPNTTQIIIN